MRRGLLTTSLRLQAYGHALPTLLRLPAMVPNGAAMPSLNTLEALKSKFIELIPSYMGTVRGELNSHFRMLLTQRKTLRMNNVPHLFGIYNVYAGRALWQAIDLIYVAARSYKRVLFVSDEETEEQLEIQSLNCMLYEPTMHAILEELGHIDFYYTSKVRTLVPLGLPESRYFDLVVVCLKDYTRLNRTTFQPFARFTLGVCAQNTRPSLFDYYVPALGTYNASVQLLRDVAVLGYLSR